MRKYIIGFVAGILIATVSSVGANTLSLVGKKIQSEASVTLDGKEIDTAIIVDGKSYAPIRSVAEATGLKAGYSKGVVKLETQTVEKPKTEKYWVSEIEILDKYLTSTQRLVDSSKSKIQTASEMEEKAKNDRLSLPDDASDEWKQRYIDRETNAKESRLEAESEFAERQARVTEIEADLAHAKAELAKLQK